MHSTKLAKKFWKNANVLNEMLMSGHPDVFHNLEKIRSTKMMPNIGVQKFCTSWATCQCGVRTTPWSLVCDLEETYVRQCRALVTTTIAAICFVNKTMQYRCLRKKWRIIDSIAKYCAMNEFCHVQVVFPKIRHIFEWPDVKSSCGHFPILDRNVADF